MSEEFDHTPVDRRPDEFRDQPLPPCPEPPRRVDAARSFIRYDIESSSLDQNLRDDLEHTSFPVTAEIPTSPAARLMEMILLHGDVDAVKQLDRYLLEYDLLGVPDDVAAKNLDVSLQAYRRMRRDYQKRMSRQIERLDVNSILGRALGGIDSVQQEMYKTVKGQAPDITRKDKTSAAANWYKGEELRLKILHGNRFYERRGYVPKETEEFDPKRQVNYMVDAFNVLLEGGEVEQTKMYEDIVDTEFDDEEE